MIRVTTRSAKETKKIAALLAKEITRSVSKQGARILALRGNLGAGKTTFVQGFAKALGIKERIKSPTFVLIKIYNIRSRHFKYFIHIDCYRIKSPRDFSQLGVAEMFQDCKAIILIEWPERIRSLLPHDILRILFKHGKHPHERFIRITN